MKEVDLVVSGADLTDSELQRIKDFATDTGSKLASIYEGDYSMQVHVRTYNEEGSRKKFSLKASIMTPVGAYHSQSDGWDIMLVSSECMKRLERIVIEDHKKHVKDSHTN